MNPIDISIIIPVYFNEGSIKLTYNLLKEKIFIHFPQLHFEIIFIDDGSKDKSYKEICEIVDNDPNAKSIQFTRNFGQVSGFYAGYEYASGKGILNIAADLQEPPELIINMITSFINNEAKIIAGKRIERDESYYRTKTSKLFYNLMRNLSFKNMPEGGFDIVLLDEQVKHFILNSNESNPFWQGQLLWSGYSIKFIPYNRQKREIGKSKWTFTKKIKYLLDGILNYSYLPLRFFSIAGIVSFLLGLLYSIIIVISYCIGNSPFKGWAPLMIIILIFSGMQLMVSGLIGEYLWRTFEQTKNRPRYLINEKKLG
jgi:polyisoprenyl-phosphate glycosyltransferase